MVLAREHNERMSLAWHTAALHRAKRMTPLKNLIAKTSSRKRQTWQEQKAVMSQWAVAMKRIDESNKATRKPKKHGRN